MAIALTGISGIGPSTAKVLMENGFKSANDIAQATVAELGVVPGFSTARASRTIKAAGELLSAPADATNSSTQPAARKPQTAKRPVPISPSVTSVDNDTKETEVIEMTETEQEELEKSTARKVKKAAKKVKKAAKKKAKKAKKEAKKKAKKAKKEAKKKAKKAKKAAKKKAKKAKKKKK